MPDRPDYAALTRGQIAVLDRINAGEVGLPVLNQVVRLAQDVLGGRGAGFAEYSRGHGRIIAATGACAFALGRRVDRADRRLRGGRTLVIPLNSVHDGVADELDGAGLHRMLGARCETSGGVIVGWLHVYYGAGDGDPGPEQHAVMELLAGIVGRLYAYRSGLPVHGDAVNAAEQAQRQEDRDLWVAVTSHELRTPVTVIKGYADTLTKHWDSLGEDGRREAVRIIGTRAAELARLVDRLLSVTSDDGEVGGAPAGPFDLVEAVRQAVGRLPADLRRRLVLDGLPAELPKAYGDRDSLATILTELTTNADKYSPPDTAVELSAEADDQTVTFRVADRGIGVPPEHAERAFERYWQGRSGERVFAGFSAPTGGPGAGSSPVRGHHLGAGLGLYLVRRVVERQRGWVSLRPREGGGTVAEVRLPRG